MIQQKLRAAMLLAFTLLVQNLNAAGTELLVNGDFATGNNSGWTVNIQANSEGLWLPYTGSQCPLSLATAISPTPTYGMVADSHGPFSTVLYQDVTIPTTGTTNLTFTYWFASYVPVGPPYWFNLPTLDYISSSNLQFRVDIMKPTAPDFSLAAGDVLANLLQSAPGTQSGGPTTILPYNLNSYAGQTIRLRFAFADNVYFANFGIYNVSVLNN